MVKNCTFTARIGDQITLMPTGCILVQRDGGPMFLFANVVKLPPETIKAAEQRGITDIEASQLASLIKL